MILFAVIISVTALQVAACETDNELQLFVDEVKGVDTYDIKSLIPSLKNIVTNLCLSRNREKELLAELLNVKELNEKKDIAVKNKNFVINQYRIKINDLIMVTRDQNNDLNESELEVEDLNEINDRKTFTKYVAPFILGYLAYSNQKNNDDALVYGFGAGITTMMVDDALGQPVSTNLASFSLFVW